MTNAGDQHRKISAFLDTLPAGPRVVIRHGLRSVQDNGVSTLRDHCAVRHFLPPPFAVMDVVRLNAVA